MSLGIQCCADVLLFHVSMTNYGKVSNVLHSSVLLKVKESFPDPNSKDSVGRSLAHVD